MGFTVTGPAGTSDLEFEAYLRVLRRHVKDIGKAPRVPDPSNPRRRWVHVWESREGAQRFADELAEESRVAWAVVPTDEAPSEGPLGPVLIQVTREGDGLSFALHSLSRAVITSLFPASVPTATDLFIDKETWEEYREKIGGLGDYVEAIIPALTGLSLEQLADLGYGAIDWDTERALVYVPPAGVAQVQV